ncbi:hypothetical protein [Rhizobium leguminosarum]|uniref:hypothetical protein n=1 Tax=Rhizobium leguminosarum TaxID=384 RepID=UPI002E15BC3E|nr:hypothetical protein U8Q02_36785 [Rhizobium leguminosarum]
MTMSTSYVRLSTQVTYDGLRGAPWFRTGLRHKFRLDDMPTGHFLPNMGTEVDGEIHYGTTGMMKVDILIDDVTRPLLREGATFTLHDSPSKAAARGTVLSVEYDVDRPLSKGAYGED